MYIGTQIMIIRCILYEVNYNTFTSNRLSKFFFTLVRCDSAWCVNVRQVNGYTMSEGGDVIKSQVRDEAVQLQQ